MATLTRRDMGVQPRVIGGMIGGIAGGLLFGLMMAMMGMLSMVASVVGSHSPVVGFLHHLFNSISIGAVFGAVLGA